MWMCIQGKEIAMDVDRYGCGSLMDVDRLVVDFPSTALLSHHSELARNDVQRHRVEV